VLQLIIWGKYQNEDYEYSNGYKLKVNKKFILDLLQKINMDMIISVDINRRYKYGSYQSKEDSKGLDEYLPSSKRVYLMKQNEMCMSTESLIELGKRLVEEFKLEDKTDTLSQWMLHYLAELFERYNLSTSPEEKRIAALEIKDTIFKLWDFRHQQSHSQSSFKNTSL
jgi:hypothetical protein